MSTKKLQELLQEQQEPFTLELYLLERGYPKNKLNPKQSFLCFSPGSSKLLKRSASSGIKRGRNLFPICSKLLKVAFNKLASVHLISKSPTTNDKEIVERKQENEEDDRFSSASSTTVFNSCSESDTEEVGRERELKCGSNKNKKQLSPVSVLEEIQSDETSPVHNTCSVHQYNNFKTGGEVTSTISNTISTKKMNMALLQTKQLLCDCVREAVETRTRKYAIGGRQLQFQEFLGAEEIGEIICEKIWTWSKKSADKNELTQVSNLGLLASKEEWSDFEQQKKEIAMVIGDLILEDINNEFVVEMMCN
ncbi:hypothetical protein LguiB_017398 [Lonicera macranthoides]